MSHQASGLVVLAAILQSFANLMMRHGLLSSGGFRFDLGIAEAFLAPARQPMFGIGVVLYGLSALVWFRVLSVSAVSSSYPILVGLSFIVVTAGAAYLFEESVSLLKILGMFVILSGVVLVTRS